MDEYVRANWLKHFCSQSKLIHVVPANQVFYWWEKEDLDNLSIHLLSPPVFKKIDNYLHWRGLQMCVTSVRPYLGAGKLNRDLWPRACSLRRAGLPAASRMPSGCSHPPSCTLSQEAASGLRNVCIYHSSFHRRVFHVFRNWIEIFFLKTHNNNKTQHHQTQQINKNLTKPQNLQEQLFVVKHFLTHSVSRLLVKIG